MKRNENSYKKSGVNISLANKLVTIFLMYQKKMSKKGKLKILMKLEVLAHYLTLVI